MGKDDAEYEKLVKEWGGVLAHPDPETVESTLRAQVQYYATPFAETPSKKRTAVRGAELANVLWEATTRFVEVTDGQLAKYHLTMERLFVLRELATARAPLNMKALARRLSVTPATMSDLVGRLIRDGHVLHCADAFDRRIKVVKPTVNGLYVALVASSLVAAATNRLMAALSSNDKKALVRALQRMKAPEPSQAPTSTAST